MTSIDELHKRWSKNAKYKNAYDDLEGEYALISALIDARVSAGLTQAQLAKRMQTTQSVIARLEGGQVHPSTRTLEKLAVATGRKLKISFEPLKSRAPR